MRNPSTGPTRTRAAVFTSRAADASAANGAYRRANGPAALALTVPTSLSTPPRPPKKKKRELATPATFTRKQRVVQQLKGLRTVTPRTPNQGLFLRELADKSRTVLIGGGIPGSGKTLLALYGALAQLADPFSPYEELIIFKSVTLLKGEEMGFLPGDKDQKLQFIYQSFFLQLERLLPDGRLPDLLHPETGALKVLPIGCIRGISIPPTTIVIVDECQNLSVDNTHAVLTRFEEGAKLICIGDESQRDASNKKDNGLTYLLTRISNLSPEVATVCFTEVDCVRKKLIKLFQRAFDAHCDERERRVPSAPALLRG